MDWQTSDSDNLEEYEVCPKLAQTNCTTSTSSTPLSSPPLTESTTATTLTQFNGVLSPLVYSNWSEFTTCTTTCGDGAHWRSRSFSCPAAEKCVAVNSSELIDVQPCNIAACEARSSTSNDLLYKSRILGGTPKRK